MSKESYKNYIKYMCRLLKDQAKEAKIEADHPKEGYASYNNGYLMAYHTVISLLKNQAPFFGIAQEELGLADVEPERDLL